MSSVLDCGYNEFKYPTLVTRIDCTQVSKKDSNAAGGTFAATQPCYAARAAQH